LLFTPNNNKTTTIKQQQQQQQQNNNNATTTTAPLPATRGKLHCAVARSADGGDGQGVGGTLRSAAGEPGGVDQVWME
jgi:hypothetical protein